MRTNDYEELATRVSRECVGLRSRKLSRVVTRIFDDRLREHNLTATQFTLLAASARIDPPRAGDLCVYLAMEKSTLSRNLGRLARRGLISLAAGADGRERLVSLTREGQKALVSAFPAWELAQEKATEVLGKDAVVSLDALLGE